MGHLWKALLVSLGWLAVHVRGAPAVDYCIITPDQETVEYTVTKDSELQDIFKTHFGQKGGFLKPSYSNIAEAVVIKFAADGDYSFAKKGLTLIKPTFFVAPAQTLCMSGGGHQVKKNINHCHYLHLHFLLIHILHMPLRTKKVVK